MTAWIVVSDGSRATLYTTELPESNWTLVQEFDNPAGREPSRQIEDGGPPGRGQQGESQGGRRTAFEPRTWPKEAETIRFAQQLTDYLEQAVVVNRFDHLTLVAPPHFLGLLKKSLGQQTGKRLRVTVDKDLTMYEAAELRKRLTDKVFNPDSGG